MNTSSDEQIKSFLEKAFSGEANLTYGQDMVNEAYGGNITDVVKERDRNDDLVEIENDKDHAFSRSEEEVNASRELKKSKRTNRTRHVNTSAKNHKQRKKKALLPVLIGVFVFVGILTFVTTMLGVIGNPTIDICGKQYRKSAYSIYIEDSTFTTSDKEALKKFNGLGTISFTNCDLAGLDLNEIKSKAKICTVTIDNCTGINEFNLSGYKELRELNIINSGLTMNNLKLCKNKKRELRTFNISGNKDISDLSIVPIDEVHRLNISETSITDLSLLTQIDYLAGLDVSGIDLGANRDNIDIICNMRSLSTLALDNCNTGNIEQEFKSKYLYELSVAGNNITDLSYQSEITELKELNLSDNPIHNVPFIEGSFDTLRRLDISDTDIDADNIEQISKCSDIRILKANQVQAINDFSFVKDMAKLELIEAAGCGIEKLDGIEGHDSLNEIIVPYNKIESLKPLNALTSKPTCDLRYNNITTLSELSQVGFDSLILSGNDISLSDENGEFDFRNGVGAKNLIIDYTEDLINPSLKKVIGGGNVTYLCVANLPGDKQDEYKDIYSVWGVDKSTDEIDCFFDGRDYENQRYIDVKEIGN